jgi:excinuclease ABC subunit B
MIGRAARNTEAHVVLYADKITGSMKLAIDETNRRRSMQQAYNAKHGITPTTVRRSVTKSIANSLSAEINAEDASHVQIGRDGALLPENWII